MNDKCKEMTDERAEELADAGASGLATYVEETGRLGVGIVHNMLLEVVSKLSNIFRPEDIVTAMEMLTNTLKGFLKEIDEKD